MRKNMTKTEKEHNKDFYREMYKKLYSLFEGVTPVKKDCGVLCGAACCRGDERTGMILFPFEETKLRVFPANGIRYAVCEGKCIRSERPLSCRIFPLFPALDEKGRVSVIADPRGYDICPLSRHSEDVIFDRRFVRNVKKAGKILAKDERCKKLLLEITSQTDELSALLEKLEK